MPNRRIHVSGLQRRINIFHRSIKNFARRLSIVQPKPRPAGLGNKRTIARRLRRENNNKKWLNNNKTLQNNSITVSGPLLAPSLIAPSSTTSSTTINLTATTQPTLTFLDPAMQSMAMMGLDEDSMDLSHTFT